MEAMSQLELRNDTLRATIDTLGATLSRLSALTPGGWRDIALSSWDDPYIGRTVGRYANRLAGGRFSLDGQVWQTDVNEPPNSLHGGADGFSQRQWVVVASTATTAALRLTSPDGDQGYPGQLEAAVVFDLAPGALTLTYAATTDRPTVVNLTLHPYFNLTGDATIDDHRLQLAATDYTPTGPDGIPTGAIAPVAGTGLDFTRPRQLGGARAAMLAQGLDRQGALDHNFVVPGQGVHEMARLIAPDGLALVVLSDAPGVQIYDAAWFDGSVAGPDHRPYGPHAGLAIEPQSPPDAPNQPNFPNTVLRPGETWSRTITFAVSL